MEDIFSFTPPQNFTIYNALELKSALLGALAQTSKLLKLNLSQVTEIDSSGLQLLILLRREAKDQGKHLELVEPSDVVQEIIDFCNLNHFFLFESTASV